ncbi:MAG: acyloxyacyl hydrolase, partial [Flavobacteriales bacterium]|nr:acyloxyacyl hydrolase [Flavobacteriales bacterium]
MSQGGQKVQNISHFSCCVLALVVMCALGLNELTAQTNWREGLSVEVGGGFMVPHRPELNRIVSGHSKSVMLAKEWEINGTSRWHYHYAFPTFGVEVYASDLGNRKELGRQLAFSAFGHFTLGRGKLNDYLHFGAGVGFTDTKWDIDDNPQAIALGSTVNAAITLCYYMEKQFKSIDLYGGLRLTHLSNSAVVMPNLGTNNVMVSLGARIKRDRSVPEPGIFTAHLPRTREWRLQYSLGLKQVTPAFSPFFFVHTLSASYYRRPTWFKSYFIRTDLFYNSSLRYITERRGDDRITNAQLFQHGISLGWAQILGRSRLEVSLGTYTININKSTGRFYNRLGFRHALPNNEHVELSINLMSHLAKAHHLEL